MSMRIRAKLILRNDKMLAARERMGWTQAELADMACVSTMCVQCFEKMDFTMRQAAQLAGQIAEALEIAVEDVMPEQFEGKKLLSGRTAVGNVEPEHLLGMAVPDRLMLPSGSAPMEQRELIESVRNCIPKLAPRLRMILEMRFGLVPSENRMTLEEVGREVGITKEQVRKLEHRGLEAVRMILAGDEQRVEPKHLDPDYAGESEAEP